MENKFKYSLNQQVWFQYEGKNYTSTIFMRGAMERFYPANAENPQDEVVFYNCYAVKFRVEKIEVQLVFKESEFGRKVFADKGEFVDKMVVIN